jgi:hypothetical protein
LRRRTIPPAAHAHERRRRLNARDHLRREKSALARRRPLLVQTAPAIAVRAAHAATDLAEPFRRPPLGPQRVTLAARIRLDRDRWRQLVAPRLELAALVDRVERDHVPAFRRILGRALGLQERADEVRLVPAREHEHDRRAGRLTRVERRVIERGDSVAHRLAVRFLLALVRVVNDAEREPLAHDAAADAGGEHAAAVRRFPMCCRGDLGRDRAAGAHVVAPRRARVPAGERVAEPDDRAERVGMPIEEIPGQEARDKLALPVARRLAHDQSQEQPVGDVLASRDQKFVMPGKDEFRLRALDPFAERELPLAASLDEREEVHAFDGREVAERLAECLGCDRRRIRERGRERIALDHGSHNGHARQ